MLQLSLHDAKDVIQSPRADNIADAGAENIYRLTYPVFDEVMNCKAILIQNMILSLILMIKR